MNTNRNLNYISLIMVYLSCIGIFTGCEKNSALNQTRRFIHTQINCEIYKETSGNEALLKETFLEFFNEETYQKYLDDVFGYMYPQLFYITNANEIQIQKIKCNEITKQVDGSNKYQFEVKYIIIPEEQEKEDAINISMKDVLDITVDKENKLTEVIILNTSDTIKKLFLDVKVQ